VTVISKLENNYLAYYVTLIIYNWIISPPPPFDQLRLHYLHRRVFTLELTTNNIYTSDMKSVNQKVINWLINQYITSNKI